MPRLQSSLPAFGSAALPEVTQRWKVGLLVLAAVVALANLWSMSTWQRSLDSQVRGTLLAGFEVAQPGGWQRIDKLDVASPLRMAGAAVGDAVRFSRRGEAWLRRFGTDERIELELRTAGRIRTLTLQPIQDLKSSSKQFVSGYVSIWGARWLSLLIGALLALRRPDSPAIRGLAVSLILGSAAPYSLPPGALREQSVVWLSPFLEDIAGMGGLWFAFQVQSDQPIWRKRAVMLVILGFFSLLLISLIRWALQWRLGYDAPLWSSVPGLQWLSGSGGYGATWAAIDVATVAVLCWSWFKASDAMRVRIAWITVALSLPMLWDACTSAVQILDERYSSMQIPLLPAIGNYPYLLGAVILGWAVLRQRVFDFGLVVQRALAYSIVSTMLIAVLGIGKWLTESFLQIISPEHGFIHDGAIVLAVVVAFALLQQRITPYVTRVFFSGWHRAAEALRDFVEEASHITDAEELKRRFVSEVDAFTGGSGSAIYAVDADGNLHLEYATLTEAPPNIEAGGEVAVKLKQGAARVDLSRFRERNVGDWAFPMTVRSHVRGALVIGSRTEGVSYRPEELNQLADSVRTIGLNLESLRAADLQQRHDDLAQQLSRLTDANKYPAPGSAGLDGAAG